MDVLSLTKQLVSIDSQNPFKGYYVDGQYYGLGSEAQVQIYIEDLLKSAGFSVQRQVVQEKAEIEVDGKVIEVPERWNLYAEMGSFDKYILAFGHTDTVDIKKGWKTDPFEFQQLPGANASSAHKYLGLGSNDMKGGLAAVLAAALRLSKTSLPVKLAFLCDEEYWSQGSHAMVSSGFLKDISCALCPEICDDENLDDTEQWLGLGRLGRTEYEFTLLGKSCHGSDAFVDKQSINATQQSAILQYHLLGYFEKKKKKLENGSISAWNSLYISYQNGGNPTLSVPETASFIVDRSFLPGESVEEDLREINELIKDLKEKNVLSPKLEVTLSERKRPTPSTKPFLTPEDHLFVSEVQRIIGRHAQKTILGMGRSVADENIVAAQGIPTLTLSPTGGRSHTNEEWIDIRSLERLEKIYFDIFSASEQILKNIK